MPISRSEILEKAFNSPLPQDYKTALAVLAYRVRTRPLKDDPKGALIGMAWPSTSRIADEMSVSVQRAEMVINNLAAWGILSIQAHPNTNVTAYRIEVSRLAAELPLFAALLNRKVRHLEDLSPTSRHVIQALAELADWNLEVRACYADVVVALPWITLRQYQYATKIMARKGLLEVRSLAANQHRRSHWQIVLDSSRQTGVGGTSLSRQTGVGGTNLSRQTGVGGDKFVAADRSWWDKFVAADGPAPY